jgi:hypothetical protein
MTRVTTGTGLRHTARAINGDRATRDSYGHAHPPPGTLAIPGKTTTRIFNEIIFKLFTF